MCSARRSIVKLDSSVHKSVRMMRMAAGGESSAPGMRGRGVLEEPDHSAIPNPKRARKQRMQYDNAGRKMSWNVLKITGSVHHRSKRQCRGLEKSRSTRNGTEGDGHPRSERRKGGGAVEAGRTGAGRRARAVGAAA